MRYSVLILLLTCLSLSAQKEKKFIINLLKNEQKQYQLQKPSDSTFIMIGDFGRFDSKLGSVFQIRKDIPDGEYTIYVNKQLKSIHTMKKGVMNGKSIIYYDNGKMERSRFFKDGKKDGIQKLFYESGEIWEEVNYVNGNTEGISKYYFKNGKVKRLSYYENDHLKKTEDFDEEGNLLNTKTYNQD